MKQLLVFLATATILTSCANSANDSTKQADSTNDAGFDSTAIQDDTKFAVEAADGGMLEVELGKLAQTNASSRLVKEFGQMMVNDHSKAVRELKAIAAYKNMALPSALGNKHLDDYNELAKKKGKEFDKAYTSYMVDDHREDIEEFKKQAEKGKDAELKNWAAGKVPVLEHHLMMARAADSTVRKQ